MSNKQFKLDEYLYNYFQEKNKNGNKSVAINREIRFQNLCQAVKLSFQNEWDNDKHSDNSQLLETQKRAIIGYETEVNFFKSKIDDYLKKYNVSDEWYPDHIYKDLKEAIFQENWGLAGIIQWINGEKEELAESSSAKIIGDRVYYLINGESVLQNFRISEDRRNQLIKALLLSTPKKRLTDDYYEVYMLNGIRITIYGKERAKKGQDTIIFRKFFVKEYTFDKQADLHTIPYDAIPLFKEFIRLGFNIAFIGAVRTAKTTFLTTWQSYEDPKLEGVMIETDPEVPLHQIMPNAPIMQLVADGDDLEQIMKSIVRSDGDYVIIAEARDGVALNIGVKVANKGTRRVKMTWHTTDTVDFCYDVAEEIHRIYGGSLYSTITKVAKSFNYIFQFVQLRDKRQKRLKGIYEIRYNQIDHQISIHQICKYNYSTDDWSWYYAIGEDKEVIGEEFDINVLESFKKNLKILAEKHPMEEITYYPSYNHLRSEE